jgi:hypothetical protein
MGTSTSWNPLGHSRPVTGLLLPFTANYNLSVKLKPHLFTDTRLYERPSGVKNSLPRFVQALQIYPVYNIHVRKKSSKNLLRLIKKTPIYKRTHLTEYFQL